MTPSTAAVPRPVLADALPGARVRDVLIVIAGALLTAACAQISIKIPGSPVPLTGQTFAVVLVGAGLGARRGGLSMLLYVALGLILPVYASGAQGTGVLFGSSGGYLFGFILAAWAMGLIAERGGDRRVVSAALAFAVGQLLIFGVGVPWLKVDTSQSWGWSIHEGFTIFILGGVIKAALAGVLMPSAWRLLRSLKG
ncbi:MAG TPA: biotin transporter BioY [Solirubrobacteraceae bacterium]|jgi:biotin transport system substrate-specific component